MYKLLIVDDEPNIRAGLKNLIEWEVYGIEVSGEAEDGMKAYLQIKLFQPDIALIDISMPNMTGLELIELCSQLDNPPKFIILSGYNDFEYVRTAIRYGAINYLLKPVDQEDLTNTIISTVKLLDDTRAKKTYFKEGIQVLRNDTLLRLITNRIDSKELREKGRFLNLSFRCSSMRVGLLCPAANEDSRIKNRLTANDILSCQSLCNPVCSCYAAIDNFDSLVLIFIDYSHSIKDDGFQELLLTCAQQLSTIHSSFFYTALGPTVSNSCELHHSYQLAQQQVEKVMTFEQIRETDLDPHSEGLCFEEIALNVTQLIQSLKKSDIDTLTEIIHSYFQNLSQTDLESIKYALIETTIEMMQKLDFSILTDESIGRLKQKAFTIIRTSETLSELEDNLLLYYCSLSEQLQNNSNPKYSPLVQNILNHVKDNYHDCNLSLKTLAARLDVNPTYLGRQFSLETKEYFSDYLNRIRINQAIHLLTTTSWKTAKIAESVGFANISYFFTIFKKVTGGRPGDYRKNIS